MIGLVSIGLLIVLSTIIDIVWTTLWVEGELGSLQTNSAK